MPDQTIVLASTFEAFLSCIDVAKELTASELNILLEQHQKAYAENDRLLREGVGQVHLEVLLKQWATVEAVNWILLSQPGVLDPNDLNLQRIFCEKLERKYQSLYSQLEVKCCKGSQEMVLWAVDHWKSIWKCPYPDAYVLCLV